MFPKHTAFAPKRIPHAAMIAIVAGVLLTGCVPPDQATAEPSVAADTAAPATSAGVTTGGDGSEIQLDELTENDLEDAELSGELACSFSTGDTPPILFATGIVASDEPAQGVVKVSGYVERIGAPGGFGEMTDNPTFTGQGKTIRITVTGPASGGGESPPRPATLVYERADGASRSFDGHWQCGP